MSEELAPIKAQVYKDPRPKEYFDKYHERARTREPDPMYELVRAITSIWAWTASAPAASPPRRCRRAAR